MAVQRTTVMERQTGSWLLPLLGTLMLVCCTSAEAEFPRGFLLTAPKLLYSGSTEKICIAFHAIEDDVLVKVSLMKRNKSVHSQGFEFENGVGGCVDFEIPRGLEEGQLSLVAEGSSETYNFSEKTDVGIGAEKTLTYIQTDKPLYKPGQTVQFRVLVLDQDIKPKDIMVSKVYVQNPSGLRVMQWTGLQTSRGFLSLDLPISEEPTLGTWKIKADILGTEQVQTFKVEEYVLPKFEVVVNTPAYILVNEDLIDVEVCARYTYGKPVKGSLSVSAVIKRPYFYGQSKRPEDLPMHLINGCKKVQVNSSALMANSRSWSLHRAKIQVTATVKEEATGISMSGDSFRTEIKQYPVEIDLKSSSPNYFKPGLPFIGKCIVTKPDGVPAVGELIQLSVNNYFLKSSNNWNFTTDENGEFIYTLPPLVKNKKSFMITARALKYGSPYDMGIRRLSLPMSHHSVKQWFSLSGSFVQISPVEQAVDCGTKLRLNVSYTTTEESLNTFNYQLMSHGNILLSGSTLQHFESNNSSHSLKKRSILPMPPLPPGTKEPETPVLDHVASFHIDITIIPEMSPTINFLVYYLHSNGEVVADSIVIKVNKCFRNQVSMDFGVEQLYPGESVSVDVRADADSVCALGVVDKSVHLLGGNNQLNRDKVFASIKELNLDENAKPSLYNDYCDKQMEGTNVDFGLPDLPAPPGGRPGLPGMPMPIRRKRMVWPGGRGFSQYFDSSHAFKISGMVTLSDMYIDTRPCTLRNVWYNSVAVFDSPPPMSLGYNGVPGPAGLPAGGRRGQGGRKGGRKQPKQKKVVDLRNYFPETWIWEIVEVGSSGQTVISERMPHSITEWVGSAMCVNSASGLGISAPARVRGFQPFFASFTLPYSVIRGEKVPILLSVFNYLSDCLVVELTLKKEDSFRVASDSRKKSLCVCGSETVSHTFHVVPTEMGKINITVLAVSVAADNVCGNGVSISSETGARDAVTRTLIVEAEGREEEYSKSSFICPGDQTYMEMFDLNVPENHIRDSARGYITAIGDVMGPSLSGLDALLRLPTGCGEQNMLKFSPNIYIMQYLTATDQDAPKVRKMALDYMRTGYQRELTYRHEDGSYSAFGESDEEGSMWLTAFVVKSFAQARSFIYIDKDDLDKSLSWFKSKQLENGCFPQVGKVLHKAMKGGLANGENPTASLTAYVLTTMLSAGIKREDRAVQDSLLCLRSQTVTDPYTLAQMAYAYSLYDSTNVERAQVLDRLEAMAVRTDGMVHWEAPKKGSTDTNAFFYHMPKSADVELTAYVLLAYISGEDVDVAIQKGLPIVRWLSKQRNAYGGFASTQDTVVALQALAGYASMVYGVGSNVRVNVQGRDVDHRFDINDNNKFVLFSRKIDVANALTVQASGQGCVLFQANVKYNMPLEEKTPEPAFEVRVSVPNRGVGNGTDACKKRKITVCSRYTESDSSSNMAIVAVKMVSGWIPIKGSVNRLKDDTQLGIKRIEIDHKWVNFYFDELTAEHKCLSFEVEQDMEIEHVKPAFVHVYDYYEPELSVKLKYKIRRVCGTKNELPVLTRKEYEEADHSEQRRVPIELPPEFNVDAGLLGPAEEVCPVCLTQVPEDFVSRFCLSRHAYKAEIRHKARYPLKLLTDLRLSTKKSIQRYTNFTISPVCACATLSKTSGINKIIILTKETTVQETSENRGFLNLRNDVTLIPMTPIRQMHRRIRKIHKSKTCDK